MSFQVNVKTAVSRLGQVDFLQPLFEAVTNSLEANADKIDVSVDVDDSQLPLFPSNGENEKQFYKIIGFTVTDNGDGFTHENIQSFKTLYSDAKRDFGCKGVGRLTWLKVFQKVKIESRLKISKVVIDFDENFSEANVKETQEPDTDKTSTRITFSDVLPSFLPKKKSSTDKREDGNIEEVCRKIKQYLLAKLALLKEQKRDFYIAVTIGKECRCITTEDIPDLTKKQFPITGCQERRYDFTLLYSIISNDRLNQKKAYYCANGRTVSKIPNDAHSLKDINTQDSIVMLLTSKYLDEKVNDERNDFTIKPNEGTLTEPISFSNINDALKDEIGKILSEHYPETEQRNKKAVENAIKEKPFLADYIREDTTLIKTESRLIENAGKAFAKQKQKTSEEFSKMLKQKNVDPKTFNEAVIQVNQVAFQELGEYILYRQQIIDALNKALEDKEKKEKYIHDLMMPMKSDSDDRTDSVVERGYATNLWLLDDKYMTYSYAASDKTIKQVTKAIAQSYDAKYKSAVRPDIAVFFNRSSNSKDVIVCELKGTHASADEKNKSITELSNNIGIIRKNIENTGRIWGYIITEIDDDFKSTLEWQDFAPLFTNNENGNLYFKYLAKANAYITVLDLKTMIADASARNKLFLEILSR